MGTGKGLPACSGAFPRAVAAIDSFGKLIGVLIFYAVYSQMENAFLTANIMRSTVDLPPLTVIVALILGGSLAGITGALVAVPTAALIAALLDEYLVISACARCGLPRGWQLTEGTSYHEAPPMRAASCACLNQVR